MFDYRLDFQNPIFKKGLNVTVRKGDKWDVLTPKEDTVSLYQTGENAAIIPECPVLGKLVVPMYFIPYEILTHEHDPMCRTQSGLLETMQSIYGDDLRAFQLCTVILFEVP
jgi:hypothetical protein